jgi:DNA-directed RNA polymerase subunit RPC12/RpoP
MSMQMYPCPHCKAELDSLKSLEYHLGAMHADALPSEKYRCVTCDAEFVAEAEWLDQVHEGHGKAA